MSSHRRLLAFLASLVVLGAVGSVEAQPLPTGSSATVAPAGIMHSVARSGYRTNNQFNYSDCIQDDHISIPLTLVNPSTYTLQAWVGIADCTAATARSGAVAQCWLVGSQAPSSASVSTTMSIPVRAIVAGYTLNLGLSGGVNTTTSTGGTGGDTSVGGTGGATSGSGGTGGDTSIAGTAGTSSTGTAFFGEAIMPGPEACVQPNAQGVITATNFTVQFMLIDPSTNAAVGPVSPWTGKFKLAGPQPPINVSAGVGGNLLVISFTNAQSTDQTINGYNFYCDPPGGSAAAIDAGLLEPDASMGPALICGTASTAVLMPGANPPGAAYLCGTAQKTSSGGNATGLVDGVTYNIAVAAVDTFDNTGTLSTPTCGVPQPVTGFFKAYRDAGGAGGGGFCSFSSKRELLPLLALIGFASCFLLRRRRAA